MNASNHGSCSCCQLVRTVKLSLVFGPPMPSRRYRSFYRRDQIRTRLHLCGGICELAGSFLFVFSHFGGCSITIGRSFLIGCATTGFWGSSATSFATGGSAAAGILISAAASAATALSSSGEGVCEYSSWMEGKIMRCMKLDSILSVSSFLCFNFQMKSRKLQSPSYKI